LSLKHWETYYRSTGALATCPTSPAGSYDHELEQAWVDFLSGLPDGAVILDIGTGNGAVVLIAADLARRKQRNWDIHGADLAQIDPPRHVPDGDKRFAGCHFHPGVATEALPFNDASVDAVCGHYALEYAELDAALAEIARVLKPDGRAQFIMHHADSLLVGNARDTLAEADLVLRQTRIHRRLRKLVAQDGARARPDDRATRELRAAIHQLQAALAQARSKGKGHVIAVALDAVQKLLAMRGQQGPAQVVLEVDRAEDEMRLSVRRLQDLLERALDNQGRDALLELATGHGLHAELSEPQCHAGDNMVGWRVRLRKPARG
jgi:SAM-dependent methyltransferase